MLVQARPPAPWRPSGGPAILCRAGAPFARPLLGLPLALWRGGARRGELPGPPEPNLVIKEFPKIVVCVWREPEPACQAGLRGQALGLAWALPAAACSGGGTISLG